MRSKTYTFLLLAGLSASCLAGKAQDRVWPEVKKEARPWTRWWWMGNAVDEKNISALLGTYKRAGFGGVEIAPIYGAKGYENRYVKFLSPQWMQLLSYTVQKAGSLNMGVDLTNGTGWPFGGPQIGPAQAAAKLIVQNYTLKGGEKLADKITVTDPKAGKAVLQSLTAYGEKGEVLQLSSKVNAEGILQWSPAAGTWQLYAAFSGRTGQMVKRAAPGGEGLTLNHFSKNAVNVYLGRFDNAFKSYPPGVRAFYNDSYEVFGADWSDDFFNQFQQKRGYDLRNYIRELTGRDSTEKIARLKSDYRETMSEVLLENFTRPWTSWAHGYKGVTKNQAHGSPGNLLDLYAAVDIPECETFGSSYFPIPGLRRDSADIRNVDPDPVMLKFASSAGHVAGHNLISCETFTWLTEHFKTSLSQAKPEVEQVFLSGVNHVFYHGTTYSPEDLKWPGWLFYASVNFVPANSWWPHLPGLNDYVSRVQSVLQSGKPDNELLIYWPVYDAWNSPKGMTLPLRVHDIDVWLHPSPFYRNVTSLQDAGYSLDFISDNLLDKASVAGSGISTSPSTSTYRVLIVPATKVMPAATFAKIIRLAENGATVIIQSLPEDVPGLSSLETNRVKLRELKAGLSFMDTGNGISEAKKGKGLLVLCDNVQKALEFKGINRERLTDSGLKFVRRDDGGDKYYYVVNHSAKIVENDIPLNVKARSIVIMDPQTGDFGTAVSSITDEGTRVKVQMQPGEALILKTVSGNAEYMPWKYLEGALPAVDVKGRWDLNFTKGGPVIPEARQLKKLGLWTSLPDSAVLNYSGLAEYTATFDMPKSRAGEYVLDLGEVRESAHVWVNGQDAGILWSIPFKARIGKYLKPGENTIKIEVANLMANRIRDMDKKGIVWRKYNEINFVNINYLEFDASGWKVQPSGLGGPVEIIPFKGE